MLSSSDRRATGTPLVIIPAYNEAGDIARVVAPLRDQGFDVLVVDDCSGDDTGRLAREAGAMVISHCVNMGYGCALQTGYRYALEQGYAEVAQLDGDGQHDVGHVRELFETLRREGLDLVVGSRFLGRSAGYDIPWHRRAGQRFFRGLLRLVSGLSVSDSTSGFQAMNAGVLRFYASDLFPDDYPDANILLLVHRLGFRIREIPVTMHAAATDRPSMHRGLLRPTFYLFRMVLSVLMARITVLPERLKK